MVCGFESRVRYEHSLSVYDGSVMPKITDLTEATLSGRLVLERGPVRDEADIVIR